MDYSTSITWFTYILPTLYNAMYDLVTICTTANHSMVLITIMLPADNRMTALECSDGDDNILKEKTNLLPLILISSILLNSKLNKCSVRSILFSCIIQVLLATSQQNKRKYLGNCANRPVDFHHPINNKWTNEVIKPPLYSTSPVIFSQN